MSSLSHAEYYKYTDGDGVLHFTDNILEVPQSQRKDVKQYQEIKPGDKAPSDEPGDVDEEAVGDIKKREETLMAEKAVLDKEYEALAAEKKILEEAAEKSRNYADNQKFEAQIEAFNARTTDYEKRRSAFKVKVDAFNAEVTAP